MSLSNISRLKVFILAIIAVLLSTAEKCPTSKQPQQVKQPKKTNCPLDLRASPTPTKTPTPPQPFANLFNIDNIQETNSPLNCRADPTPAETPTPLNCRTDPTPATVPTNVHSFAGLPNIGNTCYMNAALQIAAVYLKDKIPDGFVREMINKINSENRTLETAYMQDFFRKLIAEMETINSMKPGIVDILKSDFKSSQGGNSESLFEILRHMHNKNIIGEYIIVPHCTDNQKDLRNLSEMITYYAQKYFNDHIDLTHLPDLLYIQRYYTLSSNALIHGTDCIHIITNPNDPTREINFSLIGFIFSIDRGSILHAIAYVKRNEQWYEVDDASIRVIPESEAIQKSERARLLFYRKIPS